MKISDDELLFVTGETDFDAGAAKLMAQFPNLQLVNVTAGAQGSIAYYQGLRVFQPGLSLGGVIETTGRHFLRLCSEFPAGTWSGTPHIAGSVPDAALCQCSGLSGYYPAGGDPLHAGAGAGIGVVVTGSTVML